MTCTYCGGMGWVEADVGQVFECMPCQNAIKPLPRVTDTIIKQAVTLTPTMQNSSLVGIISEVNGIDWNDACEVVSRNELYGQDGAGSFTIYRNMEDNGDLTPYAKRAIAAIFLIHRDHDSIEVVQD